MKASKAKASSQRNVRLKTVFHISLKKYFSAEFVKIQKVLRNFNVRDTLCDEKICVGDLSVLAIKLLSQYLGNEDDFDTLAPQATALCNKLLTNAKIRNFIASQKFMPYCAL